MQIAIVRAVSPAIAQCELSYQARVIIDYPLASEQHHQYQALLEKLGCQVIGLPAEPDLADSVFVEDVALVLDEMAILTNPGAVSRKPEVALMRPVLSVYRPLAAITEPGTLEGGDILRVGQTIYVGLSNRTNLEGIRQLRALTAPAGYRVEAVPVQGCLHLKSAVSQIALKTLLINPEWVQTSYFNEYRLIEVAPGESHAANGLLIGDQVIYPDSFPGTLRRMEKAGIQVHPINVSELQKAEGAVTCCSLVFNL